MRYVHILISLVLFPSLLFAGQGMYPVPMVYTGGGTPPVGGDKYQIVTLAGTKITAATDFPVLLTEANFVRVGADIFDTVADGGGDIRITTDAAGNSELPREVVSCDTTAKTLEVWVKATLTGSDQDLYVWYNGTDPDYAVDDTYGAENVWNANYKMVQHMNHDPSGTAPQMIDSTSNNYDLTSAGTMTTADIVDGMIGQGIEFDGTDDRLENDTQIISAHPYTMSAWANSTDVTINQTILALIKSDSDSIQYGLRFNVDDAAFFVRNTTVYSALASASDDTSYLLTGVAINNSSKKLYLNGAYESQITNSVSYHGSTNRTSIGRLGKATPSAYLAGVVDEARITAVELSADWILNEYNNQSDPGTFYSVSDEVIP